MTWNFSFEMVLFFALFGQGLWEAPVLTNSTAKTMLYARRWAQQYSSALVTHGTRSWKTPRRYMCTKNEKLLWKPSIAPEHSVRVGMTVWNYPTQMWTNKIAVVWLMRFDPIVTQVSGQVVSLPVQKCSYWTNTLSVQWIIKPHTIGLLSSGDLSKNVICWLGVCIACDHPY